MKHEKFEIEKRLRRLKFEKYNSSNSNNVKKMATLIREKDLNSSDNESPDESDTGKRLLSSPSSSAHAHSRRLESMRNDDDVTINNDPATATADDQDIETLDETKIDDLDKRLTLVNRKYTLIKRRLVDKLCHTRTLHLGQDRYRRRYWYFSHLPGIYIEGLASGDIPPEDIQATVENVAKQKLDRKPSLVANECTPLSRSAQRKKQQTKVTTVTPPASISSTPIESNKIKQELSDTEDEPPLQQQPPPEEPITTSTNETEDLATMDLSAFCMAVKRDHYENNEAAMPEAIEEKLPLNGSSNDQEVKSEPSDELDLKRDADESNDDNVPLDLSCTKPKRSCHDHPWSSQHAHAVHPLTTAGDQFQELNDLATAALLLNNIKQEQGHMHSSKNLLDLTHSNLHNLLSNSMMSPYNLASSLHQEASMANFKHIEQTIREKFQHAQPMPIPDGTSCRRANHFITLLFRCSIGLVVDSDFGRLARADQIPG